MGDGRAGRQAFVPTLREPPLQELAREWGPAEDYGWRVLVLCVLLNRAGRAQALEAAGGLLRRWPTPEELGAAPLWRIEDEVRCCGFQRRRAQTLALLSIDWRRRGRRVLSGEQPVDGLPGCGRYAADAFRLFVDGDLEAEPEDVVLRTWRDLRLQCPSADEEEATPSVAVGTPQPRRATMATEAQINPRDLTPGQSVRIDSVVGEVAKVDKKGGRLTIAERDGGKPVQIKFRDVVEVEILTDDDPAPAASEEAALKAELDELQAKTQGWNARETKRVQEIRQALGLDSGSKTAKKDGGKATKKAAGGGNARPKYPARITEAVALAKKARGTTNGAPGAKQHAAVRLALTAEVGVGREEDVTKAALLDYLGMSEKALKDAASGKMTTEKLREQDGLRKVAKLDALADPKIKPWIGGRNGASILVAWIGQAGQEGA